MTAKVCENTNDEQSEVKNQNSVVVNNIITNEESDNQPKDTLKEVENTVPVPEQIES